jgi:hypothetical protein
MKSVWRNTLNIAVVCAMPFVLSTASVAKPRQGTGSHACGCLCDVQFGNGQWAEVPSNFGLPSQYTCQSAEGLVCNISDPVTGGIRQGSLVNCIDGSYGSVHITNPHPYKPPVTNPGGGVLQAVPAR